MTVPLRATKRCARAGWLLSLAFLLSGCDTLPGWMILQREATITDYRHFDNMPIARAAQPSAMPSAQQALVWPDDKTEADAERSMASNGTVAFIVVKHGSVVYERYFNGYARDSVFTSFSMAKSVVSALLGIAIHEGSIASVDDPVTRYLPSLLKNDPRFERITLRHLVSMRSGIAFDEGDSSPFSDSAHFYLTRDLARQVAALKISGEPDQAYSYESGNTQVLGMAIERAVGMPLARFLETRLWQPMGAEYDASWSVDSAKHGVVRAFCCLNARAIDYARFGLVYLNGGVFNGRELVPADWITRSTAAQSLTGTDDAARRNIEDSGLPSMSFYAWQWQRAVKRVEKPTADADREPGANYYAEGLYGQIVYIAPATDTVLVRLGSREGDNLNWPRWMGRLARLNP